MRATPMSDPVAEAKHLLRSKSITGIPAESLEEIARQEKIGFLFDDFPNDPWLDGMLLFKGAKRAIIVNTHIGLTGKHNFTFAHELGHYFLKHPPTFYKDGESGIRCSSADIEDAQKPREIQANRFAVELLMPEERFRLDMAGAPIDFGLITGLSNRYLVSKHACSNRIAALTSTPCIIIWTKGQNIFSYTESRAAKGFLKRMKTIPSHTIAFKAITKKWGHNDFAECSADKWLIRNIPGSKIYECTHVHAESGTAMTILKW